MHTNIELSKKLFELSGWRDDLYVWAGWSDSPTSKPVIAVGDHAELGHQLYVIAPCYEAGYLLRKLENDSYDVRIRYSSNGKNYRASLLHYGSEHAADTPEDALCRLAIKLFKAGILKPERTTDAQA